MSNVIFRLAIVTMIGSIAWHLWRREYGAAFTSAPDWSNPPWLAVVMLVLICAASWRVWQSIARGSGSETHNSTACDPDERRHRNAAILLWVFVLRQRHCLLAIGYALTWISTAPLSVLIWCSPASLALSALVHLPIGRLLYWRSDRFFYDIGVRSTLPWSRLLVMGALCWGMFSAPALAAFQVLRAIEVPASGTNSLAAIGTAGTPTWLILFANIFGATIAVPISEELFYRGFLLGGLNAAVGARWAVLGSAIVFALSHSYWPAWPLYFFAGLGYGFVRVRSRSLIPGMIAHSLNNLIAVLRVL